MIKTPSILSSLLPGSTPENLWALFVQGAIILFLALVVSFLVYRILARLSLRINAISYPYTSALLKAVKLPLALLVWFMAISWFLNLSRLLIKLPILQSIPLIQKIIVIILLGSFLLRSVRIAFDHIKESGFKNIPLSASASEAISKLLQVCIVISTILLLLQSAGISISGLLAFGGLGGLIVGFAAKDTLANLFSGVMLYMDRPFQAGDRISISGKHIEGTVEHIGWRQTRVRNYALEPIYVPNSLFGNTSVVTPSRMLNRRIRHTVGIRYQDFKYLPAILEKIKTFLLDNEEIDQQRAVRVYFVEYSESSLNIQIYCFSIATGRDAFLQAQQKILIEIGRIILDEGADFAFPTRTLDVKWPELPQG